MKLLISSNNAFQFLKPSFLFFFFLNLTGIHRKWDIDQGTCSPKVRKDTHTNEATVCNMITIFFYGRATVSRRVFYIDPQHTSFVLTVGRLTILFLAQRGEDGGNVIILYISSSSITLLNNQIILSENVKTL